jgi:acyl-CoA synthetase (AMP-forming)/AMP-acid ligase II
MSAQPAMSHDPQVVADSPRARYFAGFLLALDESPEETALLLRRASGTEALGFAELGRRIAARMVALRRAGLRPGEVVLIFSDTRADLYASFFAAQFLGAVPSVMPPPTAKQDAAHWREAHRALVARIRPGLVCGLGGAIGALGETGVPALDFGALAALDDPTARRPVPEAVAGDLALLQHSSGTTGLKKGVMLGYDALVRQAEAYGAALDLQPGDKVASWLPLYHDMGLIACTVLPFVAAMPVLALDPFEWLADPLSILRLAEEERATLLWLPNFAFDHLAGAARRLRGAALDLSGLRAVINCSEVCRAASMDRFLDAFAPHGLSPETLHTCYALAENVFAVTQSLLRPRREDGASRPAGPARLLLDRAALDAGHVVPVLPGMPGAVELVSSGRPIEGCALRFLPVGAPGADPDAGPEGTDQDFGLDTDLGEILIVSDCLFDGYFGEPALSEERFVDGWLRTRDLGFLHDGELYVLGRLDDVLIYRGRNLVAPDLEAALAAVPAIRPGRAVVFSIPDERIGSDQIVVLYEAAEGAPEDEAATGRAVRAVLGEGFAVNPVHVGRLSPGALRKTTSGKISRALNRAAFLRAGGGNTP